MRIKGNLTQLAIVTVGTVGILIVMAAAIFVAMHGEPTNRWVEPAPVSTGPTGPTGGR